MRRLLLLFLLTVTVTSSGCVAAIPLLWYAAKNRQASIIEPPRATDFDAVRLAGHEEPASRSPADSIAR